MCMNHYLIYCKKKCKVLCSELSNKSTNVNKVGKQYYSNEDAAGCGKLRSGVLSISGVPMTVKLTH